MNLALDESNAENDISRDNVERTLINLNPSRVNEVIAVSNTEKDYLM